MNPTNPSRILLVLLLSTLLVACAGSAPSRRDRTLAAGELLDGSRLGVTAQSMPKPVELLAINDEMRAFLQRHVPEKAGERLKIKLILEAVLQDGLRLQYSNFKTSTAEEAFYAREGNCMSFTNLVIALAREVGLRARFQEVETPPVWVEQGETWFYNLHINALIEHKGGDQVVDFNLDAYDQEFSRRAISDDEALARYHNNMGIYWMREGDQRAAFLNLRRAIQLSDEVGYFWANLGTLYRRQGDLDAAEQAFLVALETDKSPIAASNLARLYRQTGDIERAEYYAGQVKHFRRHNPYFLFHQAKEAYASDDFDRAANLLRTAIARFSEDHEFYRLLGLTYVKQGKLGAAKRRFRQAAALAEGPDLERYNRKLALLSGKQ